MIIIDALMNGINGVNSTENKLRTFAAANLNTLWTDLSCGPSGLTPEAIAASRKKYGRNIVTHKQKGGLGKRLYDAFINPFTIVLAVLASISACTNIILAAPEDKNPATVLIIVTMMLLSGILRFVQDTKSNNAAAKLSAMIRTTAAVIRYGQGQQEIPLDELVYGDLVTLSAGDMLPADIRFITTKDLFINQAALTGESVPVEKQGRSLVSGSGQAVTEITNLGFMGTTVISGTAQGLVVGVGNSTIFGSMAKELDAKPVVTGFEKGMNAVSWILVRFMLVMVPIVFVLNGLTKGDWLEAGLFAISVAVGLTPEMLPMLVTSCLAKGALNMGKKKVIIKNLHAIQNLGSIDILCTDKTGTLTQDKIILEYHMNVMGDEDDRVLRHGFLNSYYQTGLKNLLDLSIIDYATKRNLNQHDYTKVDEIPFDFERRRMSVVIEDKTGKTQMITKGAVHEMLQACSFVEYEKNVVPLTPELRTIIMTKVQELDSEGMRVIALAQKTNPAPVGQFSVQDEKDLVLMGYLAFLDPPKETTAAALKALQEHSVGIKILTGDSDQVTVHVCRQVGLNVTGVLLGSQMEDLSAEEIGDLAEKNTIFAKLSPTQKAAVISALRERGHLVGYMGDGINDAAAMRASDVGISVDTAVDVAKESADVILLEKDLLVLEDGIIEGRKTYANMIKYIKMTVSSNFGNMLSVLVAGAFLPFLPMAALQLILLNMVYDLSCLAIPWDNVDKEFLMEPRKWEAGSITKFMLWLGPSSSIFDIITYLLMYFYICPLFTGGQLYTALSSSTDKLMYLAVFQTGWFVESMWSQTMIIHMIRTPKLPFIDSIASKSMIFLTLAGCSIVTALPFTPLAAPLGLKPLPSAYFGFLLLIILGYMFTATVVKKLYIKRYGELL